jgi:hypothetical protein
VALVYVWARFPDIERVVEDPLAAQPPSRRDRERAGFHRAWEGTLDPSDQGRGVSYLHL